MSTLSSISSFASKTFLTCYRQHTIESKKHLHQLQQNPSLSRPWDDKLLNAIGLEVDYSPHKSTYHDFLDPAPGEKLSIQEPDWMQKLDDIEIRPENKFVKFVFGESADMYRRIR